MTAKPADEKRQEERRIKELREFQRSSPANRRCFDCNEMVRGAGGCVCVRANHDCVERGGADAAVCVFGLQYVRVHVLQRHPVRSCCLVSVASTGIDNSHRHLLPWHGYSREFAHRVKSISMSKFTETEVKNMIKFGGNDVRGSYSQLLLQGRGC